MGRFRCRSSSSGHAKAAESSSEPTIRSPASSSRDVGLELIVEERERTSAPLAAQLFLTSSADILFRTERLRAGEDWQRYSLAVSMMASWTVEGRLGLGDGLGPVVFVNGTSCS